MNMFPKNVSQKCIPQKYLNMNEVQMEKKYVILIFIFMSQHIILFYSKILVLKNHSTLTKKTLLHWAANL